MVDLTDIKKDLPGWPDEVITEWLLYLSNRDDTGWPPPDPLRDAWEAILGGRPLVWWRDVSWANEAIDCSAANLANKTREIVMTMRAEIRSGSADESTNRRFNHALHYLLQNGVFPNPVSGMITNGRLLILDGNHRIAALSAAQLFPAEVLKAKGWKAVPSEQKIWIGKHKNGEAPIT